MSHPRNEKKISLVYSCIRVTTRRKYDSLLMLRMASVSESATIDETFVHTFHFAQSDQVVSLTQKQLEHIPYLNTFVSNANNFTCLRSTDNAFVLGHSIQYILFNPILSAIVDKKPSSLFAKLPRHVDVFCMLELYDYLCIDSLPIPSLKPISKIYADDPNLFLKEYHQASPSDARDTAVEFVVAIANRKYDLNNFETVKTIFDLLVDILSSTSVFGQRLRYQTLVVAENCCSGIFTSEQRDLLRAYKRSLEALNDANEDPDDTSQLLEAPWTHMFYWRKYSRASTDTNKFLSYFSLWPILRMPHIDWPIIECDLYDFWWYYRSPRCDRGHQRELFASFQRSIGCKISCSCGFLNHWAKMEHKTHSLERLKLVRNFYLGYSSQLKSMDFKLVTCLIECCSKLQSAKNKRERQFVYSGRSHYLKNAPTVDKFKNKLSVKAQKHR